MTHTPGPLVAKKDPHGYRDDYCISQDDGFASIDSVAVCNECDASLIAAAPDMLEVLKELEESVDYWSDYDVPIGIQDRIRAAIAKAEGKK